MCHFVHNLITAYNFGGPQLPFTSKSLDINKDSEALLQEIIKTQAILRFYFIGHRVHVIT